MTDWQIHVPHRSRSDRIDPTDVADMNRQLQGDDAAVARSLALLAVTDSDCETYGDLFDKLDQAGAAGRRQILDRARADAGLPATKQADERASFEAANRSAAISSEPMRDARGRVPAICGEAGCDVMLADEQVGGILHVDCKRWFCEAHRKGHEADLEPWTGPRLAFGPGGNGIVDLDEQGAEAQREATRAKSRAVELQAREDERAALVDDRERHLRGERERLRREIPDGMPNP